jgi:hypothetical protein
MGAYLENSFLKAQIRLAQSRAAYLRQSEVSLFGWRFGKIHWSPASSKP